MRVALMNKKLLGFSLILLLGIFSIIWGYIGITHFAYRGLYFYPTIYYLAIALMIVGGVVIFLSFIYLFKKTK